MLAFHIPRCVLYTLYQKIFVLYYCMVFVLDTNVQLHFHVFKFILTKKIPRFRAQEEHNTCACLTVCIAGLTDDLQVDSALSGEGQGEEGEGVKPHTLVLTLLARHLRLELHTYTKLHRPYKYIHTHTYP